MSEHGERNRLIELLASFIELQRAQLEQGAKIMGALANLQAAVGDLEVIAQEIVTELGSGTGGGVPPSDVQAAANQIGSVVRQLDAALPATSSATSTASGPATSTATASASSTATASASSSASVAAAARPRRNKAAAAPAAEPFRG